MGHVIYITEHTFDPRHSRSSGTPFPSDPVGNAHTPTFPTNKIGNQHLPHQPHQQDMEGGACVDRGEL